MSKFSQLSSTRRGVAYQEKKRYIFLLLRRTTVCRLRSAKIWRPLRLTGLHLGRHGRMPTLFSRAGDCCVTKIQLNNIYMYAEHSLIVSNTPLGLQYTCTEYTCNNKQKFIYIFMTSFKAFSLSVWKTSLLHLLQWWDEI